jgi:sortase (surface protein transpeptidase)
VIENSIEIDSMICNKLIFEGDISLKTHPISNMSEQEIDAQKAAAEDAKKAQKEAKAEEAKNQKAARDAKKNDRLAARQA